MDYEDEQISLSEAESSPIEDEPIIKQYQQLTNKLSKRFSINIFMNSYVLSQQYKQSTFFQDFLYNMYEPQNNVLKIEETSNNTIIQNLEVNVIKQIKVISDVFTQQTSKQLAPTLKITNLTPGDHIYYSGEKDKQNLYYIHEGEVQLLEDNSQKCIQTLHQGQTFGEYSFFTGFPTKTSAKCLTFVQLVKIERTHFIQLVSEVRRDWEKFHHIKDKIGLESNYAAIYLNCSICKKYNHCNINCPLLTYQPDLELLIKKAKINFDQNRIQLFRSNQKQKALKLIQQISKQIDLMNKQQLSHKEKQIETILENPIYCQQGQIQQFSESVDIDKMEQYDEYMKANNFENSLKVMQKGMKARSSEDLQILKELSQYSFKQIVKEQALIIRKNYFN